MAGICQIWLAVYITNVTPHSVACDRCSANKVLNHRLKIWFTMLMTSAELRRICKEHKLYQTPSVNDKLFCNLRGFRNIANLEPYTGLKALFLEGNCLQDVDGIPELDSLRCLCATAQIVIPVGQVVITSIAQSSNWMLK